MQLLANGSQRAERINALARTIQRKPAPAQVAWGITHVVKKQNDSIFGGNYEEGEVGRAGELRQGQELIVDDDDIFVSRRGANQEDATIRDSQRMKDPSHEWIRVLRLGRADVSSLNLYIRLETIALVEPVASDQRPILIRAMPWDSGVVSAAAKEMGEEYVTLRNGPEKTAGAYKCSDAHWGLIDEGADVAKRLQIPGERAPGPLTRDDEPGYSRLFIAHYQGDLTPIAIMQLEMRLSIKDWMFHSCTSVGYLGIRTSQAAVRRWWRMPKLKRSRRRKDACGWILQWQQRPGTSSRVFRRSTAPSMKQTKKIRVRRKGTRTGWIRSNAAANS
jgi:hypothetical protein